VDSLIALCSTSYPQTKQIINKAFEASSEDISKVGFSLLFQAVIREDSHYLNEDLDGEDIGNEGEANDEENEDAGSEKEEIKGESSEEKPIIHKKNGKNHQEAELGKRKSQNGVPTNTPDHLTSIPQKHKGQQIKKVVPSS
jgi:hypothetical protein